MYKPKNYKLEELAHPQIIADIGVVNCWLRLNEKALIDIQTIRTEWFKKHNTGVYVNRLKIGLDSRGLRPPNDSDGSFYSTHKQGNTFDLEPVNGKYQEFYDFVIFLIKTKKVKYINTLENIIYTLRWIHVAIMNTSKRPLIINP